MDTWSLSNAHSRKNGAVWLIEVCEKMRINAMEWEFALERGGQCRKRSVGMSTLSKLRQVAAVRSKWKREGRGESCVLKKPV